MDHHTLQSFDRLAGARDSGATMGDLIASWSDIGVDTLDKVDVSGLIIFDTQRDHLGSSGIWQDLGHAGPHEHPRPHETGQAAAYLQRQKLQRLQKG